MCVLEKLNFKVSRGSMTLDPLSVLAPPAHDPLSARSTQNCFHRSCSDAENGKECQIGINLLYVIWYEVILVKQKQTFYYLLTLMTRP